jgi:transposase InsO family protein
MLSEKIARIHADSRETYGAPRIHFELRTLGVRCARKTRGEADARGRAVRMRGA